MTSEGRPCYQNIRPSLDVSNRDYVIANSKAGQSMSAISSLVSAACYLLGQPPADWAIPNHKVSQTIVLS